MIMRKLKTFAVALLATGATVASIQAAPVTYIATNVLQPVTVTLTVYEQKTATTIAPTSTFNTKALLNAVESGLGTNGVFDKHAFLALLTSNIVTQTGTSNVVSTNGSINTANPLVLSLITNVLSPTNGVGTNLVIGTPLGDTVTIVGTNATNIQIVTVSDFGPQTNFVSTTNPLVLTGDTVTVGTNTTVTVATNSTFGATPLTLDIGSVVIISNGTPISTNVIGTNSVDFTTNSVTIGTNAIAFGGTNTPPTNTVVEIVSPTSTNVVYNNGTNTGFGTTKTFTTAISNIFTVSVTNGVTYLIVLTEIADLVTNTASVTNVVPVYGTNASSELVVSDGAVNTPVPTNIVYVYVKSTNDIVGSTAHSETDWTVKGFLVNSAALVTNASDNVVLKLQGLVHNTEAFVGSGKIVVTNEAWSAVSGYGTNNGTPIVVGGTISVASPTVQKIQ